MGVFAEKVKVDAIDDNDPRQEGTELAELPPVEAQPQGESPAKVLVESVPMQNAETAITTATDGLVKILNGQAALQGDANYGVIPQMQPAGYESITSPLGGPQPYQPFPAEMINDAALADRPNDDAFTKNVKAAARAARDVRSAYRRASVATDLPTAKQAVKDALLHAQLADTAASQAERGAMGDDVDTAAQAREAANQAKGLAKALDTAVKRAEAIRKVYRDGNGKVATGRVLTGVLAQAAGAGLTALGGVLVWLFAFDGARKVMGGGGSRLTIQPITKDVLDTETTVDIDVPKENNNLAMVQAVHLLDDSDQLVTAATGFNGFTVAGTQIKYTVDPMKKVPSPSVKYVVEAQGLPGVYSEPALLTINFTPKAADAIQVANDRTTAVSFPVPAGATLVGDLMASARWLPDAGAKTVTYTPGATEGPTREITYQVTNGTQAKLIVLFPAADLPAVVGMRSADTPIDLPAGSAPVMLLDAQNAQQTSVPATGGTWKVNDRQITFTPDAALSTAMISLSVNYVVVRGGKQSKPGKATINFAAVGPTKTQRDLTFVTADRTKDFVFTVQGATLTNPAGAGNWTANAANVTFTPGATLAATEVTVTAAYQTGTEQGTLSLTYLPVPKVIPQPGVDRTVVTTVDIKAANSITAAFVVKLWNGAQAVDTLVDGALGTWSVSGTSITWSRAGQVVVAASVGVGYVLMAADQTITVQGGVQITFDTKPVAYPFAVMLPNPLPTDGKVRIKMLESCFPVLPKGFEIPANAGISWNRDPVDNNGTAVVDLPAQRPASGLITFPYTVKNQSDILSAEATVTIRYPAFTRRFLPMAADYLLSQAVLNGQAVGADVLSGCSTFFGTDKKSVRLTGLGDIGQGNQATEALLAKDGRSLRVPGEGVWVAGDDGLIGFTAEPHLTVPPSPVAFQFADVKGYLSNEALVVIDPAMDPLTAFPGNLAAMDDATFWKNFQTHVSRAQPQLPDEVFLTATSVLAGAVRAATLVPAKGAKAGLGVGRNPVAPADFEKALQAWIDNGQSWDDPVGTAQPTGLVATVAALVDPLAASSKLPQFGRYWRLELMAQMVASTLDDDTTT